MSNAPRQRPATRLLRGILGIATLSLGVMVVAPSAAGTPAGREWRRYEGWKIAWLRLEGAPSDLDRELKGGLALAGRDRLLRGPVLPAFRRRLLAEDLDRIRLFMAHEGYPAAEVTPVASPESGRKRLGLTLRIEPGPPVRVMATELQGWPAGLAPPDSASRELCRRGERFRDARIELSRAFLQRFLRDGGFALAEVDVSARPISASGVAVMYAVTPGDRYDITGVTVAGCSPDLAPLTRRLMNIVPPTAFAQSSLEEAAFDLRSSQLFRQVTLDVVPQGPGRLDLVATVENADMRLVEAGVGTWSDNPWMARVGWAHRNLLGGGQGLDAHAALATHTQNAGGGLSWFGWLSPRARTRASAEWRRESEDAFVSREWRLALTQSLRPRGRDLANAGVSLSRVSLTLRSTVDQSIVDREGSLLEIWADRKWDWTDDPLYPRAGGFGKLTSTWSPPISGSGSPYLSMQGDLSLYHGLGGGAILAGRARAGWAEPLGKAEALLPNRRFFAGGYSSMRGYGRRQLGPRDADGLPLGGDAVLLAGMEARLPVTWILGAIVFLDSGQVWRRPGDVRLADLETAAGAGLDFRTPLGPVRIGYAWNLGPVSADEPSALAYFGVGYPW